MLLPKRYYQRSTWWVERRWLNRSEPFLHDKPHERGDCELAAEAEGLTQEAEEPFEAAAAHPGRSAAGCAGDEGERAAFGDCDVNVEVGQVVGDPALLQGKAHGDEKGVRRRAVNLVDDGFVLGARDVEVALARANDVQVGQALFDSFAGSR